MNVRWNPKREYQAFADPEEGLFTLDSNLLADDANGKIFQAGWLVVTSLNDEFCDLEISDRAFVRRRLELPLVQLAASTELSTRLQLDAGTLDLDLDDRRLLIRYSECIPEIWVRVGDSGTILGLRGDQLVSIFCEGVILDPGGEQEYAWLEARGF